MGLVRETETRKGSSEFAYLPYMYLRSRMNNVDLDIRAIRRTRKPSKKPCVLSQTSLLLALVNEESSPKLSVPSISRAFSRDRDRICSAESADKAVFSILTIAFAYSEVPSTGSLPRSVSACVSGSAEDTSLSEGTKINTENQTFIEDALELELFERCETVSRHISFDLDARRYS